MRRRQVLAALGAGSLALAGCRSPQQGAGESTPTRQTATRTAGEQPTTPTETVTPTETATPTHTPEPVDLSVAVEALQPAIVVLNTDSYYIHDEDGPDRQYLYLNLSTDSGDPPSPSDLRFRFDGDEFPPVDAELASLVPRAVGAPNSRYSAGDGSGWLIFELPANGDASDAALVWNTGTWVPDEGLRARLAAPAPSLSLEWSVPETVAAGTELTMEFTVTNDGDRNGRFVAGVDDGPTESVLTAYSRPIPAGQTKTWTTTDDYPFNGIEPSGDIVGDDKEDVRYVLRWPQGKLVREVRLVDK